MARRATITQRIALEGGEEIRRTLQGLGGEGAKAFRDVKAAVDSLRESLEPIPARLNAVRQSAREVVSSLKDMGARIGVITGTLAALGSSVLVVGKQTADAVGHIEDTAAALGQTTEEFQKLKFAFRQTGVRDFERALNRLNEEIIATRDNTRETTLKKLGVEVKGLNGELRPMSEILADVAEKFRTLPNGAEKSALAMELFGQRAGPQLIPFLNEGRAGIQRLTSEAERLGVVLSEQDIEVGAKLGDSFDKVADTFSANVNRIVLAFAPLSTAILDTIAEVIGRIGPVARQFAETVSAYFEAPIRELLAAIRGDNNAVQTSWIVGLVAAFRVLGTVVQGVAVMVTEVLRGWIVILDQLAVAINTVFGTNFTGQQILIAAALVKLSGAFTVLLNTVNLFRNAWLLLNTAFGLTPIGRLITLAAALGAALVFLWRNSDQVAKAIRTGWDEVVQWFAARLTDLQSYFSGLWTHIQEGALEFMERLRQGFIDWITNLGTSIIEGIRSAFDGALATVKGWYDSVVGFFSDLIEKAKRVGNAIRSAMGGAVQRADGGPVGFAPGGAVRGPGTSKSDSILAWLSNGEFVQRAAAVRKYGLDFMNALNQGRISATAVRALMRGFNMGGLVDGLTSALAVPRFASGGLVAAPVTAGGGRPVVLNIGGESFKLTGTDDVVERIQRFATARNLRSAGRKPTWYQG